LKSEQEKTAAVPRLVLASSGQATVSRGAQFVVTVWADHVQDLFQARFAIEYSAVLQFKRVEPGASFRTDSSGGGNGRIEVSVVRRPGTAALNGNGALATLTFQAIAKGPFAVRSIAMDSRDSRGVPIKFSNGLSTDGKTGAVE
jgi:general secretion pathway protein D